MKTTEEKIINYLLKRIEELEHENNKLKDENQFLITKYAFNKKEICLPKED